MSANNTALAQYDAFQRPANPYCVRSTLYDLFCGGAVNTATVLAPFPPTSGSEGALLESISDNDLLHFADSIFTPGSGPTMHAFAPQLPASFHYGSQRLSHAPVVSLHPPATEMPALVPTYGPEARPDDSQHQRHQHHQLQQFFPAPALSAAPTAAAAAAPAPRAPAAAPAAPAPAPAPAPAAPAAPSTASTSAPSTGQTTSTAAANTNASTPKGAAALAKARINTHTGREPLITDFATPEEYQVAWMAWRQTRDANNEAVRRSRSAKRATLGCRNSTCLAMLTKLKSLHKTTALLLKASHNPQSLTRAERRNYRALLASVNAGNTPVALTVDALLAQGCDHDHDHEAEDHADSMASEEEEEMEDAPVQGPAPRPSRVQPVK